MARMTAEQRGVVDQLVLDYGPCTTTKIENTLFKKGIVWMIWKSPLGQYERNLFIKPDGTRLFWETL